MSILGKVSPRTTDHTLVYQVPDAIKATANIALTNRIDAPVVATVSLSKGNDLSVASISIHNGGAGLSAFPTLSIEGDGRDASAEVSELAVATLSIANAGSGYTVGNTVTLGGTVVSNDFAAAVIDAVDANGAVSAFSITQGGRYSAVLSDGATTGGTGSGLVFDPAATSYRLRAVVVTNPGQDYSRAPSISASAGTGVELRAQMTRAALEDNDALEFEVSLPAHGVLERTGITLGANDAVFVQASTADALNAFVFGVEAIA